MRLLRAAWAGFAGAVCLSSLAARAELHGYDLAIAPFLPVRTLVQNYQPMREYLEKRLGEPVTLITAPDYKRFNAETLRHGYPFIVTVANSAWVAQADAGYVPLLRPAIDTRPTLVVAKESKWMQISDLRGQTIALPDPLAIVAMQAPSMLQEAGLNPGRDVKLAHVENHAAAANRVLAGEAAAAVISDRAYLQLNPATRDRLRQLGTWDKGAAPGVVYLASPKVNAERVQRMKATMLDFVRDTPEGRELMTRFGYGGLVTVKPDDLRFLAPYGAQLKELLKGRH